jgi:hypothetical protein
MTKEDHNVYLLATREISSHLSPDGARCDKCYRYWKIPKTVTERVATWKPCTKCCSTGRAPVPLSEFE